MSTVPKCFGRCYRQPVLHYHAPVVGAGEMGLHHADVACRSWPEPVLLKQIEDGPLPVRVWNPKVLIAMFPDNPAFAEQGLVALSRRQITSHANHHTSIPFDVCYTQRNSIHADDHDG